MADQYGLFWNSVSGDRTYDADSFSEWLGKFFTTGVFNGDLQVTPDSGMVVNVGSGYANINGKVRFFDTDTSITISPASGVYPRIDTIVVRADYTNREITLEYVTGSYSGNDPQPTAPTRNASMYEIVLAQILVSAGSTEVTTGSITDTRPDSTVCGWVTGTVDSVAVDQLTAQAQAQFEVWFEHMKGQLSEDAAGNLQLQIDALDTRIDDIDTAIGDTDISTIGDGTVTGAVSALNNGLTQWTVLLSETALSSGSTATLLDSIENYSEIYIKFKISDRATTMHMLTEDIKNWGYSEQHQYIISTLASVNVSSSKLTYGFYAQMAFTANNTLKMVEAGANGYSGDKYFTVYAR